MDSAWGKPDSKTFRKRCIRQVRMSSCTVLVHADLADLAAEILRSVEHKGIQLPDTLGGWIPHVDGQDPREFGLAFEKPEAVKAGDWPLWFEYPDPVDGTVYLVFSGTPEQAADMAGHSETLRVAALNPQIEKDPDAWQTSLPGARTLKAGCKGDDVQFVQYALDARTTEGIYDEYTTEAVMALQSRWNQRGTGVMDEDAWKALLPTSTNHRLEYGDGGAMVRVLQAALLAYDWEEDIRVTGRYDQVTMRGVKNLQDTYGLRPTGEVGAPEWAALLGRPVRVV